MNQQQERAYLIHGHSEEKSRVMCIFILIIEILKNLCVIVETQKIDFCILSEDFRTRKYHEISHEIFLPVSCEFIYSSLQPL